MAPFELLEAGTPSKRTQDIVQMTMLEEHAYTVKASILHVRNAEAAYIAPALKRAGVYGTWMKTSAVFETLLCYYTGALTTSVALTSEICLHGGPTPKSRGDWARKNKDFLRERTMALMDSSKPIDVAAETRILALVFEHANPGWFEASMELGIRLSQDERELAFTVGKGEFWGSLFGGLDVTPGDALHALIRQTQQTADASSAAYSLVA